MGDGFPDFEVILVVIWTMFQPLDGFTHEVVIFETPTMEYCEKYKALIKGDGARAYCRNKREMNSCPVGKGRSFNGKRGEK